MVWSHGWAGHKYYSLSPQSQCVVGAVSVTEGETEAETGPCGFEELGSRQAFRTPWKELSPRFLVLAHTLVSPLKPPSVRRSPSIWGMSGWHLPCVPVPAAAIAGRPPGGCR